jgi:hypothetical protein
VEQLLVTEIYHQFGEQIVTIVDNCSEFRTEIKPPWRFFLIIVSKAKQFGQLSALVKKECYGSTTPYSQCYREVAPSPMMEELARVVAELEQL